jgi:hypothetical protein
LQQDPRKRAGRVQLPRMRFCRGNNAPLRNLEDVIAEGLRHRVEGQSALDKTTNQFETAHCALMLGVDDAKIFHDEDSVMKRVGPGVVVIFSIPLPSEGIADRNKRNTSFLALEMKKPGSQVPFHPRHTGSPSAGKNAFPIHFLFSPKVPGYGGVAR